MDKLENLQQMNLWLIVDNDNVIMLVTDQVNTFSVAWEPD